MIQAKLTTRSDTPRQAAAVQRAPLLQRKCACGGTPGVDGECAECRQRRLQRAAKSEAISGSRPLVNDMLHTSGQPLDHDTRAFMEPRFGHDFSRVRIHTGTKAAESARAVHARAYTVGQHIVFGAGQYAPETQDGQKLLAHELTHVVQQDAASDIPQAASLEVSDPHDPAEHEAERVAESIGSEHPGTIRTWPVRMMRQEDDSGPNCTPGSGISNSTCSAYASNSFWLPLAYVNNATCACQQTPNTTTANCVRKTLQDRLAATPTAIVAAATAAKVMEIINPTAYQTFVQATLTPLIYADHVIAYSSCCCPSGPAPYPAWVGVTTVPLPCSTVGEAIRYFGSCHGTPGAW
ncbi:MAG: DUF4157 domain-containing protein [Anaerolineae bacterium]|nr:DUF4157 domain-containing protein [Anaerolineae bacterium]